MRLCLMLRLSRLSIESTCHLFNLLALLCWTVRNVQAVLEVEDSSLCCWFSMRNSDARRTPVFGLGCDSPPPLGDVHWKQYSGTTGSNRLSRRRVCTTVLYIYTWMLCTLLRNVSGSSQLF
jgi:hypothetical protein